MTPASPKVVVACGDVSQKCARTPRRHSAPSLIGLRPFSRHSSGETQISVPDHAHVNLAGNCARMPLSSDTSDFPKVAIPRGECPETGRDRLGERPSWVRRARAPFRDTPNAKTPLLHFRISFKRSFHRGSQIYFPGRSPRGTTTFGPLAGAPDDARYGAARVGNRPLWSVFRLPMWPKAMVPCAEPIQK